MVGVPTSSSDDWLVPKPSSVTAGLPPAAVSSNAVTPASAFSASLLPSAAATISLSSPAVARAALTSATMSARVTLSSVETLVTVTGVSGPPSTERLNVALAESRPKASPMSEKTSVSAADALRRSMTSAGPPVRAMSKV